MAYNTNQVFDYLTEQGYSPDLLEDGDEIAMDCPLCGGAQKLNMNAQHGAWLCFRCHEEGSLHQFLLRIVGLNGSEAFGLTRDWQLSEDEEFELFVERTAKAAEPQNITPLELPAQFRPVDDRTPDVFKRYLERRLVSPELAASRGIGYAVTGRYAHRIIIPVTSDGVLYTWVGRTLFSACPDCHLSEHDCTCKYKFRKVLTPSKKIGAQPSLTLYNIDAVRASQSTRLVIVEGAFDALRLPTEAVALLKSSASRTQLTLLTGLARNREVILALDGDEAGYKGAFKLAEELLSQTVLPRVALLPAGSDPGSLAREELEDALDAAKPFVI